MLQVFKKLIINLIQKKLYISVSLDFMQRALIFFIFISFTSCNYFNIQKTSSEAILDEELQTFNWKDVDEYPSFSVCDSARDEQSKKRCFENTLITAINSSLAQENIVVRQDINDTILIKFIISETGDLKLIDTKMDSITKIELPNIEDLINHSLASLPKIYPAIKRSQPVKTQFTLPMLIQVN